MLGFVVRTFSDVINKHRKIICDNQIILFVGPSIVCHLARLDVRRSFVIIGLATGERVDVVPTRGVDARQHLSLLPYILNNPFAAATSRAIKSATVFTRSMSRVSSWVTIQ